MCHPRERFDAQCPVRGHPVADAAGQLVEQVGHVSRWAKVGARVPSLNLLP
jgi:hypothetical protein